MLWLDEIVARGDDRVRCRLTIRNEHVFVSQSRVDAVISIEWMAQAVAALVGLRDYELGSVATRPGYLIAVPDAQFHMTHFAVGDRVEIEVSRIWGDDQLASFRCQTEREGQVCAQAQLSVGRKAAHETSPS